MTADQFATAGRDGYLYGYAPVVLVRTRAMTLPFVGVNRLFHQNGLSSPSSKSVVAPNADTLYSVAWLDLRSGPVMLSIPDGMNRYRVFQFLDVWTNTFANVGTRTTGNRAGRFAIVPPGSSATLAHDVTLIPSPSWDVWTLGRTLVRGPDDLAAAREAQRRYTLHRVPSDIQDTPPCLPVVPYKARRSPQTPSDTGAAFFDELAAILAANPPPRADAPLLARLADLGILAGTTHDGGTARSTADTALLTAGIAAGDQIITAAEASGTGWIRNFEAGAYETDYTARAIVARRGLGANVPDESLYYYSRTDGEGHPLTGIRRYRLSFPAGALPPCAPEGFWSLTMYDEDMFLVPNELRRYAIGDRSDHLAFNSDGSLDLYLGTTASPHHEPNWLPAPSGPFAVILRIYAPAGPALSREARPPAIQPLP